MQAIPRSFYVSERGYPSLSISHDEKYLWTFLYIATGIAVAMRMTV